jgi:hypothetical protein
MRALRSCSPVFLYPNSLPTSILPPSPSVETVAIALPSPPMPVRIHARMLGARTNRVGMLLIGALP